MRSEGADEWRRRSGNYAGHQARPRNPRWQLWLSGFHDRESLSSFWKALHSASTCVSEMACMSTRCTWQAWVLIAQVLGFASFNKSLPGELWTMRRFCFLIHNDIDVQVTQLYLDQLNWINNAKFKCIRGHS